MEADGLAVCFFAGYNDTLDARFGQLLAHDLVVKPRHLTGRLLAHIAGGNVQRRRDFRKDGEVQPGVAVDDSCLILQEVAGEGGIRDDVGPLSWSTTLGRWATPASTSFLRTAKGTRLASSLTTNRWSVSQAAAAFPQDTDDRG